MRDLFTISILLLSICITANAQTYPEMVLVEGGSFTMGHTEIEGEPDAQPPHEVTLKSFKMAKTETTVTQWRTYCKATGHTFASAMDGKTDEAAMAYINYSEAIAYCDWLSNKTGQIYSLSTEAEWEYAARGGKLSKGFKYSGAQSIDVVGWYKDNCRGIQRVAQKRPNELGLYDMSGNVWEWCKDWNGPYKAEAQTNPAAQPAAFAVFCVVVVGALLLLAAGSLSAATTTLRAVSTSLVFGWCLPSKRWFIHLSL